MHCKTVDGSYESRIHPQIFLFLFFILEGLAQWYDTCVLVLLYNELMSTHIVSCLHFGCLYALTFSPGLWMFRLPGIQKSHANLWYITRDFVGGC